jgi:uncharacterized protein (TIGR03435 family)
MRGLAVAVAGFIGTIASSALSDATLHAQAAPPATAPAFEVATVKPNKSGQQFMRMGGGANGRFEATNVPVRLLIRNAYQLQDFQIVGAPSWINDTRFDVIAKMPDGIVLTPGPPPGPMALMMRTLLADRFKLATHTETREMPVYALVLARSDGKLGPKLTPSAADCSAGLGARGRGAPAPPQPGEPLPCGMMIGLGNLRGGAMPIEQFALSLSQFVGRTVLNKTGLMGVYDFSLTYTPEQMPGGGAPGGNPGSPLVNGQAVDLNGPSIFTAVQEQLGLKLDSQRGPVEVLVIDRVEQPTED